MREEERTQGDELQQSHHGEGDACGSVERLIILIMDGIMLLLDNIIKNTSELCYTLQNRARVQRAKVKEGFRKISTVRRIKKLDQVAVDLSRRNDI